MRIDEEGENCTPWQCNEKRSTFKVTTKYDTMSEKVNAPLPQIIKNKQVLWSNNIPGELWNI